MYRSGKLRMHGVGFPKQTGFDVLGIVIGVIIKIVEIEVLVVLGDLIDVISALGALPRECGRRHGVPFAWAD